MTTGLLNSAAVSRQSGENAATLLSAYISTGPQMALNHTAEVSLGSRPKGTAQGDQFEPR